MIRILFQAKRWQREPLATWDRLSIQIIKLSLSTVRKSCFTNIAHMIFFIIPFLWDAAVKPIPHFVSCRIPFDFELVDIAVRTTVCLVFVKIVNRTMVFVTVLGCLWFQTTNAVLHLTTFKLIAQVRTATLQAKHRQRVTIATTS